MEDSFPRISLVRREDDGKSLYFGPYSSTRDVRFLLRSIRKVVPFCTQKQPIKNPCFYSKIGLCDPCPGTRDLKGRALGATKTQYRSQIWRVISILQGKAERLLRELRTQITKYAKSEEFEKSLELRDKLFYLEQLIHLRSFERFEYSNAYDPNVALKKLKDILDWIRPGRMTQKSTIILDRIECYDISNLMQKEATASMVVATDGILDKAEYKRFRLKETGVSDFKMLSETITRRMKNDWKLPDLIVLDGGAPQVATISRVLSNLNKNIPLIGIAKRPDRIVVLMKGETKTYKFSLHNEGFKLIQQLRDESHRFAKKYHTFLRGKKFIK